jgi:hypothetical protein
MAMENILIQGGDRTPQVAFDFRRGHLAMSGESYPEDAAAFFGPILQAVREFVGMPDSGPVVLDLEMSYFNSSSAKALMNLFLMLEKAAEKGKTVTINWRYHADDDTMQESGEDFAEDFKKAAFNLCPIAD